MGDHTYVANGFVVHNCGDCEALADLGPLPLEDFPTMPGDGATACDVGCRCSVEATGAVQEGDELNPLSDEHEATLDKIAGQGQERLDQSAPAFA